MRFDATRSHVRRKIVGRTDEVAVGHLFDEATNVAQDTAPRTIGYTEAVARSNW
jgi:hypothetical protein